MTPELIALLLAEKLPVRVALFDADRPAPGWYVFAVTGGYHATLQQVASDAMPGSIKAGAAWLPCNPLAIVEHAAERKWPMSGALVTYAIDGQRAGRYCASITLPTLGALVRSFGSCPHTAAVALLREVVGG